MSLTTCPHCGLGAHICHVGTPAVKQSLVQFDIFNLARQQAPDDRLIASFNIKVPKGYRVTQVETDGVGIVYVTVVPPTSPWEVIGTTDEGGILYAAPAGTATPPGVDDAH